MVGFVDRTSKVSKGLGSRYHHVYIDLSVKILYNRRLLSKVIAWKNAVLTSPTCSAFNQITAKAGFFMREEKLHP